MKNQNKNPKQHREFGGQTLPFWATIKGVHLEVFENLRLLGRVMWPWMFGLFIAIALVSWLYHPYETDGLTNADWMVFWATEILALIFGAVVAVVWHRFILLGEKPSKPFFCEFSAYYLRYFLLGLLISSFVLLPIMIGVQAIDYFGSENATVSASTNEQSTNSFSTTETGIEAEDNTCAYGLCFIAMMAFLIIVGIPLYFIPIRIALALPASAIGETTNLLRKSWRRTKGNFFRLYCGAVTTSWPFIIYFALVIMLLPETQNNRAIYTLQEALGAVFLAATGILWVTFFSLSYKHLTKDE